MVHKILSALPSYQGNVKEHPLFQQALKTGLISNPALAEHREDSDLNIPQEDRRRLYLEIRNMWCPTCAELITLLLKREKGLFSCVIDYTTDLACIEYSPRHLAKESIIQTIKTYGYEPIPLEQAHERTINRSLLLRFVIAAFFSLNVMMFAYPLYATYYDGDPEGYGWLFALLSLICSLPVVTYCFWPILRRFALAIQTGFIGMETLVVLGVSTAFGLSLYEMWQGRTIVYFDSMTVLVALMLLGKIIESRAKFTAKEALMQLSKALPRRGRRCQADGSQTFVPLKEISIGDKLLALCGEKIVLDGEVVEGNGCCNEALLTGEAMPVVKVKGSKVIAGSIVQQGQLYYQVTTTAEQSTLQSIIHLVEQELVHKTAYQRAADRIVRYFVPIVILLALFTTAATYYWNGDLQEACLRAIAILLISCPCALGIAVPVAESHVLNALALQGIFIRNRGILKLLGKETLYVFDKTGTVTEGKFKILQGLDSLSPQQRGILKALTEASLHPISLAIRQAIEEPSIPLDSIEELPGKGLQGRRRGNRYLLGSLQLLQLNSLSIPSANNLKGDSAVVTTVYFCENSEIFTLLLGDQIRSEVPALLKALSPARCYLLSGDQANTVETVARSCGFEHWFSECTPADKQRKVKEWRQQDEVVAMLGDGINDAPALAEANIGISVISATDLSIQASDILMTTDHLQVLGQMRQLADKGRRIISQNLFWAFFYNIIGIALAMLGLLTPLFAAFAMMASSLIVTLNAQRLK